MSMRRAVSWCQPLQVRSSLAARGWWVLLWCRSWDLLSKDRDPVLHRLLEKSSMGEYHGGDGGLLGALPSDNGDRDAHGRRPLYRGGGPHRQAGRPRRALP